MNTTELRLKAAKDALADYDFGSLTVTETGQWDTSDPSKFVVLVHAEAADGCSNDISFHVDFDEKGNVHESYALSVSTGEFV